MSDLLAIFGPNDTDSELLTEIERLHPDRVTVLIEGPETDWANDDSSFSQALRERMAALLSLIERRTGATVVGAAGDRDQLEGSRGSRSRRKPATNEHPPPGQ
jgi:hypothetical protein